MCYDLLEPECPIRQGDIFYPLPYAELSLTNIQALKKIGQENLVLQVSNWDILQDNEEIVISTALRKAWGIVATQDCDASRIPDISLFQIESFEIINRTPPNDKNVGSWINIITDRSCKNAGWFYLPKDERLEINGRKVVNFHKVFQIPRPDLEDNIKLRKGRLGRVAYEHYRESIAQYYRRYPYNEWYSMNKDEVDFYIKNLKKCTVDDLYPWHR